MDLSAALHHFHHHHQEMGNHSDSQSLDSMIACSKPPQPQPGGQQQQDKKPKPPDSEPQKCPRCDSTNTKFCYYNNYSLTQPRYFCKSCRRYWTKGGTLRNVPVGGGCRRNNKRCSSPSQSFSATSSFLKRPHGNEITVGPAPNPIFSTFSGGLGLGFGFDHLNGNVGEFEGFLGHPQGGNGNGGFLINSLDHQNVCYGFGAPNSDEISLFEGGALKQQGNIESKGMWGYHQPWQMINSGDYNHGGMGFGVLQGGDLEPIKESWNGLIGNSISTWQAGLLNTPTLI